MSIKSLFSTQISHGRLTTAGSAKTLNRHLKSDIMGLMKLDQLGWDWSEENYVGGYTSYNSVADLHRRFSSFTDLQELIDKKVRAYAKALKWKLQGGRLEMTSCWANVMPNLVHHSLHLHPLSAISGTYYVAVPAGAGPLKLEDPRLGLFMGAPPRPDLFHTITPKAGDLVLWESWLRHEVSANRGRGERISISFNYEWT